MIVEIPKNSSNKFEYDPAARTFRLDRALYSPMHYPADYGFVPGTIAEDGDPLDVLCLIDHPTFTGCLIEVRPIGVLDLVDQTTTDHKVMGGTTSNMRWRSSTPAAGATPKRCEAILEAHERYKVSPEQPDFTVW